MGMALVFAVFLVISEVWVKRERRKPYDWQEQGIEDADLWPL